MALRLDLSDSFNAVAEGLRCNRAEHALIKVQVACTFLDCASTTRDPGARRRILDKAYAMVASLERQLDALMLTPAESVGIRDHLEKLRSRIVELDPNGRPCPADIVAVESGVATSLARGDMVHFFVANRQPLFAGDLFRIALRLRFLGRIQSR